MIYDKSQRRWWQEKWKFSRGVGLLACLVKKPNDQEERRRGGLRGNEAEVCTRMRLDWIESRERRQRREGGRDRGRVWEVLRFTGLLSIRDIWSMLDFVRPFTDV